jgi:hypothetical protein
MQFGAIAMELLQKAVANGRDSLLQQRWNTLQPCEAPTVYETQAKGSVEFPVLQLRARQLRMPSCCLDH